jgi:hypothetical protein
MRGTCGCGVARLLLAGGLGAELLELLNRDSDSASVPLALAGLLRVLEERLAERGVAREPAGGFRDLFAAEAEGSSGKLLAVYQSQQKKTKNETKSQNMKWEQNDSDQDFFFAAKHILEREVATLMKAHKDTRDCVVCERERELACRRVWYVYDRQLACRKGQAAHACA